MDSQYNDKSAKVRGTHKKILPAMPVSRRQVLQLAASSTYFLSAGPRGFARSVAADLVSLDFPQGVASGDPQPDGIMLWTRAVPKVTTTRAVKLLLQLSLKPDFSQLLVHDMVTTHPDHDLTVRAYIDGLEPNSTYYYRFLGAGDTASRIGRTRTAPAAEHPAKIKLAFASCQSYEQAHYGCWARMLAEDRQAPAEERIHFVLHLGDFIYERCWHTHIDGSPQARKVPPFPDGVDTQDNRFAVSLADYRHLYKTYLSDPHLQAARANWPFICTWDDHEFANNAFQSYSTYGDTGKLEDTRKLDANQAWFEYIPAVLTELAGQPAHDFHRQSAGADPVARNQAAIDSLRIYRRLRWGKYLDIVLTDSRSYRSPACLPPGFARSLGLPLNTVKLVGIADGGRAYNNGHPPAALPYANGNVANPARDRPPGSMLGVEQRTWMLDALAQSDATWKLWGNAMPLIPLRLDTSALPFYAMDDTVYSIDGWAGYPHEISVIMDTLEDQGITGVVSLSGDHHMHGAGTVSRAAHEASAAPIMVDFTVAGISSSPLFGDILATAKADHSAFGTLVYREMEDGLQPVWHMSMLDGVWPATIYSRTGAYQLAKWMGPNTANPGLAYLDTTVNGYGLASVDADAFRVTFIGMEDCRPDFTIPPAIGYTASFHLPLWAADTQPELSGPVFSGVAPFPFIGNTAED
ncbi:MAG: alkaline phosphatase D family protein [Halioglobus sp.]|nr:alkaline phosphatase D family protein [Halioglobus sp.]